MEKNKKLTEDPTKNRGVNEYKTTEWGVNAVQGMPTDTYELLHKYGTYEIQPTADSDNEFPEIAQGLPKEKTHKEIEPDLNEPFRD